MSKLKSTYKEFRNKNSLIIKRYTTSTILTETYNHTAFEYPKHDHKTAYFLLTDNCSYKERLGRKTFIHSPKTILWRPKEISHADAIKDANGRFFSVYIRDKCLDEFSQYAKVPREFSEKNSYLVFLALRLQKEFRNWTDCSPLIVEGLALELLGHSAKKIKPVEKNRPKWMNKIIEKLNAEFTQKITNEKLAAEIGIHPVHLAAAFRKFHNLTIGEYVKKKRIEYAMQMLSENTVSLAEIAYKSGFSDQGHFTRVFKNITGITPGVFRDSIKGQ